MAKKNIFLLLFILKETKSSDIIFETKNINE
jgi:hypothetical protein